MKKYIVTAICCIVCLYFFGNSFIDKENAITKEKESYSGNSLTLNNAALVGNNVKGQEYTIRSKVATNTGQDIFQLQSVEIMYKYDDNKKFKAVSQTGIFNKRLNIFDCTDNVNIYLDKDYVITAEKMTAKFSDNTVFSDQKVIIKGEGVLTESSNGGVINLANKTIDFHGPVYSQFSTR